VLLNPLVSVAVITYNQDKFINECLDSILIQDYPNFEIIVADDSSVDNTYNILQDYQSKFPNKIKIFKSDTNKGITSNSNLAYSVCSGKYISWMGGDDLMLPNKLTNQVEFMEKNPICAISYHNLDVFDSITGKTLFYFNEKNKINGNINTIIEKGCFNGACSNMTRTSQSPKSGYNPTLPVASDWLFWIETLSNGGTINYIDQVLGKYRRHDNNITKNSNSITQNEIDHLNTCNILISKYPHLLNSIMIAYSTKIRDIRNKTSYFSILYYSLKINFNFKAFLGLIIYFISFKKIKI
jgi:glycosyltransferase involved in cell wall biosynthesis